MYRKRFPTALIVGVGKCGSGALLTFLDLHPDIVIAAVRSETLGKDPGEVSNSVVKAMPGLFVCSFILCSVSSLKYVCEYSILSTQPGKCPKI